MQFIKEEDYAQTMDQTVLPYLEERKKSGYLGRSSGPAQAEELYYECYDPGNAQAALVISHGFSESVIKYKEMIYYFLMDGYQVYLMDHRGHGHSIREIEHPHMLYVTSFRDYVRDLHRFVKKIVKPGAGDLPLYLLGHSMGGAIAAAYLESYPGDFQKAVLCCPMLRIQTGGVPEVGAYALAKLMSKTGKGNRPVIGQQAEPGPEKFETSPDTSLARFTWYLQQKEKDSSLQTTAATYAWLAASLPATHQITAPGNCSAISTPILMFLAGKDTFVGEKGIRLFAKRVKHVTLVEYPEGKHELYQAHNEILEPFYRDIFTFLKADKIE